MDNIEENYTKQDLEDILNNLPILIWLKDKSGKYIYVNKTFCDTVELTPRDIIGKKQSEISTNHLDNYFETTDKEILKSNLPKSEKSKFVVNNKCKWIKSFRNPIVSSSTQQQNLLGISNDITAEKEKEIHKYSKLENRMEIFLDTAADLYCIVAYDGLFEKVNSRFFEYLGWTEDELYKMKYQDLIHPKDFNNSLMCRKNARLNNTNKGYGLINRYKCKDGTYKTFSWNWNYIVSENRIILTGKNITDELLLKEEQTRLKKEIEIETLRTNFFANISHEFRTPINIILTTIQLLSITLETCNCTNNKDKLKQYCTGIKQNSYRLLRLVNNLLEMTKIDQGYNELKPINCNIVNLIENIVLSVAQHIKNKNRNIIFDTEEEEIFIAVDPDKIETIILNLISNAIKFSDDNGNIEVYISKNSETNEVIVSVKDDGKTIDYKYSKMIFERFTQIDDLLNRPCEGSGLGLALVKSLIDAHKGRIWVNTDYTDGAEIVFALPITKCDNSSNAFRSKTLGANIERYNVEFSDIYNLN